MNKFKNATKRIVAIATSAALVSSSVFAGLGSYPTNFVKDGAFNGQVVMGAAANGLDSAAATSVIDDLKAELSSDSEKVKITYKSSSSGAQTRDATRSNEELNYNETLGASSETGGFDDQDLEMLADNKLKNAISDTDYSQTLQLQNGTFNHALRDNVAGVTDISDNIYYAANDNFATYTLTLDSSIDMSSTTTLSQDFVGETLNIMGNEFTISAISKDSSDNLNKLTLVGGANKISLGEGESTTVTVNGVSYDVAVQSVGTDKVLLSVNGESKSVDQYDTADLAGVSIAVTDLVSSSRDAVKGYAEIVIGGQKIELRDGGLKVKVNDVDIDKVFPAYYITSDFGTGFSTITVTYAVDDDTSLVKGDTLTDVLFDAFTISMDGTNEPTYETIKVSSQTDDVKVAGNLINGNAFSRNLLHSDGITANGSAVYLRGAQDEDRIFFSGSTNAVGFNVSNGLGGNNGVELRSSEANVYNGTIDKVFFNLSNTGIRGSGFLLPVDNNEQYLYEVASVDINGADREVDFDEIIDNKDESTVKRTAWGTDLSKVINVVPGANTTSITLAQLGDTISFANDGLLVLDSGAETDSLADTTGFVYLNFSLDAADVDTDNPNEDNSVIRLALGRDTTDDEWDIKTVTVPSGNGFTNSGLADSVDGSSDVREFVTIFGTKVVYDNKDKTYAKIMIPNKQLAASVSITAGTEGVATSTVTVDAANVDAKKTELTDAGNTIVSTENLAATTTSFDITAPVLDSSVTGMADMIVVGGPAVNTVAAALLGMSFPTNGAASGVESGTGVIRYFESSNSILVYGYEAADTVAAANALNKGGLSGDTVNTQ